MCAMYFVWATISNGSSRAKQTVGQVEVFLKIPIPPEKPTPGLSQTTCKFEAMSSPPKHVTANTMPDAHIKTATQLTNDLTDVL